MICPNCHSENRDGAKFCNECGFPLSGKIAAFAAEADDAKDIPASEPVEPEPQTAEAAEVSEAEEAPVAADLSPEPEPVEEPDISGNLERTLPTIDVEGVNVDEDGNEFDFDPFDDADTPEFDYDEEDSDLPYEDEEEYTDETGAIPPIPPIDPDRTADLSGIECLVEPGYVPPQASWKTGDTMQMPRIEGQEAPKQREFRAPDANAKRGGKGKVVAIVVAVLVFAAIAAAGITYQMELWGGKMVPDVVGLTQSEAQSVLEGKGFTVRATQVKSDETEGIVLLMDPSANARQETGTEVVIHVSIARTIPDVVGKQRDEAQALLTEEAFENVKVTEQKSDEAPGTVLDITPAAKGKAKAATPITLTVAVPYTVPEVAGKGWDDAKAALEAETYVALAYYVYDDSVTPGTVVGTDPAAGTQLASGSNVTVNVAKSRGSELEAAARSYLQSAGSISIGGTMYEIASVDGVSYQGNDQTSFTITGSAVTTLDGETVRGSTRQRTGTITWNSANEIVSIA